MEQVQNNKVKASKKRTAFNTTINVDVQKQFREYCDEIGMPLNIVLESFMKQFANGEFELKFGKANSLLMDLRED